MPQKISDRILMEVQKPTRYVGNEWNSVHKYPGQVDVRFAFCFPDLYEVGMSHLGMKILYHMLNDRNDVYCERVFAPWVDMEQKMRENNIPLFALESGDAIHQFDFIGFTLQYEMSYTNIVNMLDLADVPLRSSDRGEAHPIICAGGPCAYNPEPLADIIDFFMMGEGEEVLNEVMDLYIQCKKSGSGRMDFLEKISGIEGVYVPQFYKVEYNEDGTVASFMKKSEQYPEKIRKRIIKDLDNAYFPEKIIVPFMEIVHDRIMLEIFRGCTRGCRFCQAGIIYRPVRERTSEKLVQIADALQKSTGYEEISLSSLSTSDYRALEELTTELLKLTEHNKTNLALPSLRVDSFSLDLMQKVQKIRKSGLTFAPEAGTQRMRDVINKGVTEQDLIRSVTLAFEGGWNNVKLYFMIGLPTETMEDVEGIGALAYKVLDAYFSVPKEKRNKGVNVTVSTSSFVPKAFTPFQWEAQDTMDMLREKQEHLKGRIKSRQITYNWHEPQLSFLEGVFARGDRKLSEVLIQAQKKGCKFDGWNEHFDFEKWMETFRECGIDPYFYTSRKRAYDEILPWDHIDVGVTKNFLIKESERALKGEVTPHCRENCTGCGATIFGGGVCVE
ncbi:TIGR03960 family B12-binding radical SAM protein [Petroclostridium sp. X23]|uniref:TIGR03960 family B12-binding radical SAM protein n=1 Tax=Petroclostridium sp. X23 TaxID=3045146 RepID=UPI0024ADBC60|nr:TIGR03960 family B12-binding radical SAM protein [Petroclostridium sp. X23]WHH58160.1 TIGR03960 family B12-binding radical SAM protein [Petroclostridium sp. X23]